MLALAFFGILHVPINVPALAVSTHQDVDLSKEILGHGVSNILSGLTGATQNYLTYSNSLLFIRSGGSSSVSGFMLFVFTLLVWVKGNFIITYIPTLVVGALIFHLGIDLMKESLWDTLNVGMHPLEYFTIVVIVITMAVVGFTEGIIVGVLLACVFFVLMYSNKSIIRETFDGAQSRSTVHRLYRQQTFLDKVGKQIRIIKLQGFMFFGTVNQLSSHILKLIKDDNLVKFVILDFSLISGVDFSGLETFLRIKSKLEESKTNLVFCGLNQVEPALRKTGIFERPETNLEYRDYVHIFETLNDALEWSENQLLLTYYENGNSRTEQKSIPHREVRFQNVIESTPRLNQLASAANSVNISKLYL